MVNVGGVGIAPRRIAHSLGDPQMLGTSRTWPHAECRLPAKLTTETIALASSGRSALDQHPSWGVFFGMAWPYHSTHCGAPGLARISHTIFTRSKSFARRLDSRFRNVLARGAGGRERSWDSIGAAGWQQTIDLGGPEVMPRFLRAAAARVRPANRARLRQH